MGFIAPPNTAAPAFQLVGANNAVAPSSGSFGASTFLVTGLRCYLSPVPYDFEFAGLGVNVTVPGAPASIARLGFYAADYTGTANGSPGVLLENLGAVATDAIAFVFAPTSVPVRFRQPVWVAAVYNDTPTVSVQSTDSARSQQQTGQTGILTASGIGGIYTDLGSAQLPATLAGAAFTQVAQGNCASPIPYVT